jgi:hypothetical protein
MAKSPEVDHLETAVKLARKVIDHEPFPTLVPEGEEADTQERPQERI